MKPHLKWILIVFFYLQSLSPLTAQRYTGDLRFWGIDEGLAEQWTKSIYKDSRGYLWIASDAGVQKFDGYKFKLFQKEKKGENPYAISHTYEDQNGNLWFYFPKNTNNNSTIYILPKWDNDLINFDEFFKGKIPFNISEVDMCGLNEFGDILIETSDKKLYRFRKEFEFIGDATLSSNHSKIQLSKHLADSSYWLLEENQLFQYNKEYQLTSTSYLDTGSPFLEMYLDSNKIWFVSNTNFAKETRYDHIKRNTNLIQTKLLYRGYSDEKLIPFDLLPKHQKQIYNITISSKYVIAYGKEYVHFYKKDGTFIHSIKIEVPRDINDNLVLFYISEESENTFWLTSNKGIVRIFLKKNRFKTFLPDRSLRGINLDHDGNLFVNTYGGIFQKIRGSNNFFPSKILKGNHQLGIYKDNDGALWFGEHQNKIFKFNSKKNKVTRFSSSLQKTFSTNVIFKPKNKNDILLGTNRGLYILNQRDSSQKQYPYLNGFEELNRASIQHFHKNEEGIWIATSHGIFLLDIENGIQKHFQKITGELPMDNIVHIYEDKDEQDIFWLASRGGGLIKWNSKRGDFFQYTIKDGLPHNIIYAIYEDDYGYLWISSHNGLIRFKKDDNSIRIYRKKDGIANNEFNYLAHFKDEDGQLYFGGVNGLTVFHPKDLHEKLSEAPLHFTKLEILNGETGKLEDRTSNKILKNGFNLESHEKAFTIYFSLLDFDLTEKNKYAYLIEGYDQNWNYIDQNFIRINALPYGAYTLKVKGQNAKGQWAKQELAIPFHVLKPLYLQWWFIILMSILFTSLGVFYFTNRNKQLERKNKELEKIILQRTQQIRQDKEIIENQAEELLTLDMLKTRFFANITHELRTPLTLILAPLQRLQRKHQTGEIPSLPKQVIRTLDLVHQNGKQLQHIVEEILDLSRLDFNKIHTKVETVNFFKLVTRIFSSFESHAEIKKIHFQLDYQLDQQLVIQIDTQKTKRIITNLLSNAFKFTHEGGKIILIVREVNQKIQIDVSDTGRGIHEDDLPQVFERFYQTKKTDTSIQGGLGIGLAISKEFAKLMKGTLSVKSTLGKGSTFTLILPFEKIIKSTTSSLDSLNLNEVIKIGEAPPLPKHRKSGVSTVLIVEDNIEMQRFVQEVMSEKFETVVANNGKAALEALANQENIDIVISDVMMPEMDGFTLIEKMKNHQQYRFIPTILLTARADQSNKLQGLSIGVNDYLAKPFEPEELLTRVKNLLEYASLRKETLQPSADTFLSEVEFKEEVNADHKWLNDFEEHIIDLLERKELNIISLAQRMAVSERQLHRRTRELTGLTPGNFIKEIRMKKARHLLESGTFKTVSEVAYAVGFSTPDYFSKQYKDIYGKRPSSYFQKPV